MDTSFEFVAFGMEPGFSVPTRVLGKDNTGKVWEKIDTEVWQSVSEKDEQGNPIQIRHGLRNDELVKIMRLNNGRRR